MLGCFYLEIVQAVLLFISETWVMTPHIMLLMGGFQYRVVRWISSKHTCIMEYRTW